MRQRQATLKAQAEDEKEAEGNQGSGGKSFKITVLKSWTAIVNISGPKMKPENS